MARISTYENLTYVFCVPLNNRQTYSMRKINQFIKEIKQYDRYRKRIL